MKRSVRSLVGYALGATDGEIGKVKEFYFDNKTWTVRYLIVETGSWLSGRKVLISPEALLQPDWESEVLPVNLTREQVKNSPDIDTDKPVSRQEEMKLYEYYPWKTYWGGPFWGAGMGTSGMMDMPAMPLEEAIREHAQTDDEKSSGDPHLWSTSSVEGFGINANDGAIGDVEDFIIDDSNWVILYLVVDTGKWLPGKKVMLPPQIIKEMNWETSSVIVDASIERIRNSPEFEQQELYQ